MNRTGALAYLDTSALFKRYQQERGSERVNSLWEDSDQIFISALCFVEVTSIVTRLCRNSGIDRTTAQDLRRLIFEDIQSHAARGKLIVERLQPPVVTRAVRLVSRGAEKDYALRTLDALHLATAMERFQTVAAGEGECLFVTFDNQLALAAKRNGLRIYPSKM